MAVLVKTYLQLIDNASLPDSKTTDKLREEVTSSELRSFKPFYGEYSDQALSESLAVVMRKMQEKGMTIENFKDELRKTLSGGESRGVRLANMHLGLYAQLSL